MIIFLYGPDSYRRKEKKDEIIYRFRQGHSGLGLGCFDLESEGGKMVSFLKNQSIFESAKIAAAENFYAEISKDFVSVIKESIKDKKTTILVSENEKPPKNLAFLLKKTEGIFVQEFDFLKGSDWKNFIREEAKKVNVSLEPQAVEFLGIVYEKDPWGVVTELEKISLMGRKKIGRDDLLKINLETSPDFWGEIMKIKGGKLGEKMETLEGLFSRGEPAAKVFNILAGLSPEKAEKFAAYDLAVKSGKCDYEEILLDYALTC